MLLVAVPWAMSFRTLCFPCGTCRPRYALRIFRPTMPSTYASPRAVSLVVFTDMAIVRREISSSISYTASFLGTICLEVPSPIPTVFFLHLTVALQRRTVYDFLISGHLLPDRELREREYLMIFFRPKSPGRKNSGSRYNRFPSANFSRSKTTRSKFWTMIP
jgi:hypothetical protein